MRQMHRNSLRMTLWQQPLTKSTRQIQLMKRQVLLTQEKKAWYFKSDASGNVAYDADHYLASWNGDNSDAMFTWIRSDGSTTYCIPLGELRVQEVQAPGNCILDSTVRNFSLEATKDSDGEFTIQALHLVYDGWSQAGVIYNDTPHTNTVTNSNTCTMSGICYKHSTATAAVLAENEYSVGGAVLVCIQMPTVLRKLER